MGSVFFFPIILSSLGISHMILNTEKIQFYIILQETVTRTGLFFFFLPVRLRHLPYFQQTYLEIDIKIVILPFKCS